MIIIGIDPGKSGSLAIINGKSVMVKKMPETPKDLFDFVNKFKGKDVLCYLEKVGGLPGMGGSAMFNFGKGYGHLEMVLIANDIKFITVTPQVWQKYFQIGTTKSKAGKDWKNILKAKAQQLFPKIEVTLWSADALLIAEYGMNKKNS